jgi:hypothetical protein
MRDWLSLPQCLFLGVCCVANQQVRQTEWRFAMGRCKCSLSMFLSVTWLRLGIGNSFCEEGFALQPRDFRICHLCIHAVPWYLRGIHHNTRVRRITDLHLCIYLGFDGRCCIGCDSEWYSNAAVGVDYRCLCFCINRWLWLVHGFWFAFHKLLSGDQKGKTVLHTKF